MRRKRTDVVSESWAKVNSRNRIWPNEDGTTVMKPVTMFINPTGTPTFCFKVPQYMQDAMEIRHINEPTAQAAEQEWTTQVNAYSVYAKSAKAELVIVLFLETDDQTDRYDRGLERVTKSKVEIAYSLAYRIHDKLFKQNVIEVQANPNAKPGDSDYWKRNKVTQPGAQITHFWRENHHVLPHTPELEEKIALICTAIKQAGDTLSSLVADKATIASQLLQFGGKLALPAPAPVEDDDEL